MEKNDYSRALIAARQAVAYAPFNPDARDLLIRAEMFAVANTNSTIDAGDLGTLLYNAEVMIEREPQHLAEYQTARGYLLLGAGDPKAATLAFDAAIAAKPQYLRPQLGKARSQREQGDDGGALATLKQARHIDGTNTTVLLSLAQGHARAGELSEAIAAQAELLKLQPKATAMLDLARLQSAAGKAQEAGKLFRRAITKEPEFAPAHVELGNWLLSQGKASEASAEFDAARKLGASVEGAVGLGKVALARGDFNRAEGIFDRVYQADSNSLSALYFAARAREGAGKRPQAANMYAQFLNNAARSPKYAALKKDAQARLGRLRSAPRGGAAAPRGAPQPR